MKRVFQIVAAAVTAVLALLLIAGLVLPRNWRVERSLLMNATPQGLYAIVSDLKSWPTWADGPLTQGARFNYDGSTSGQGAARSWNNPSVGNGRTTIVRAVPSEGIWFESVVRGETKTRGSVTYQPTAAGTEVTWREQGELPWVFGPFLRDGVQRELGSHFEHGLKQLKQLAEERERQRANP